MKTLILISMIIFSFGLFAKEKAAVKNTKAKVTTPVAAKTEAPCDSKEDILKKLEEKKKAEAASAAPKGFSLQGGDTGCKIK